MYEHFRVTIRFRDMLLGGLPTDKKSIEQYVEAKYGHENVDLAEKIGEDVQAGDELEEKVEITKKGFRRDDAGLWWRDYQIKAALKQYASLLGITTKKRGTKNALAEGTTVRPVRIPLMRNGGQIAEADGTETIVGRVTQPGGKKVSIISQHEYAERASLTFDIYVLRARCTHPKTGLTPEDVRNILVAGQEIGMGSVLSREHGKYDLVEFEHVDSDVLIEQD